MAGSHLCTPFHIGPHVTSPAVRLGSQSMVDAFLSHLDQYLLSHRQQLAEVFRQHDRNGSGAIERGELDALICRLMPGADAR